MLDFSSEIAVGRTDIRDLHKRVNSNQDNPFYQILLYYITLTVIM